MKMKRHIISALFVFSLAGLSHAKEIANVHRIAAPNTNRTMAGCEASKSSADLDVNNVRTRIWINGDMWWDLSGTAIYEIPRNSKKNSMFAGAIWIGGKDAGGNLKIAAQTYRQSGSDFWPGAIDTNTVTISPEACLKADHHFKITFAEVSEFHQKYQIEGDVNYPIPQVIKDWPGNGNLQYGQTQTLAPYYDRSGDGVYDYNDGDYPKYRLDPSFDPCDKNLLLGDQTIWWVFNDVGNIHGETGGAPIGVEIHAQAFGFTTNDEINNMTFYRYKIINRASGVLNNTYFGSWVDPDLGYYLDDFVGCDVARGLGYCFNGDDNDQGATGYGLNPPAVGLDFFEGPVADSADGKDNNRNGIVDEAGEQIIMAKFVYYNNDFSTTGNPNTAGDYYNYLDGYWKDGNRLVYGGTGYDPSNTSDTCDFMFPGDSDPNHIGTFGHDYGFDWSETFPGPGITPNPPSDRRFLQSAGKFTLKPGAINYITTGAVWARTSSGGANASVKLLKLADVKAQNLFESCFKIMDGPDAPDLSIRELDKEILISFSNPNTSNNYQEKYTEKDNNIPSDPDAIFRFEGYKIYQVLNSSVTINDLDDADLARIIFQCDITNGVKQIVNQEFNGDLNAFVPTEEVFGADAGLKHSLRITSDLFASGDPSLINHKTYYFMAVAYAFDSVAEVFDPLVTPGAGLYGMPYIQSRKNSAGSAVPVYTAIPHIPAPEALGLTLNTTYGDGPEITRYTGFGNGYVLGSERGTLELKQEQVDAMLYNGGYNFIQHPTYERGRGPVNISIYDPVKVPPVDFDLWLTDTNRTVGRWILRNLITGRLDTSETVLEFPYDQLFTDYGFSINMTQVDGPGRNPSNGNAAIGGTATFANPNNSWLTGFNDIDQFPPYNWINSGKDDAAAYPKNKAGLDDLKFYEKFLGGTWAPYMLVNSTTDINTQIIAPAPEITISAPGAVQDNKPDSMRFINSIDVVITPDRSKWSRCVVFEEGIEFATNQGSQYRNLIRKERSLNLDGSFSTTDSGFSYFPGYAINVETGERLNIAFGEDSYLQDFGGRDMQWNPNNFEYAEVNGQVVLVAGGKHYIYVFGNRKQESGVPNPDPTYYGPAYDGCQFIHDKLWNISVAQLIGASALYRREFAKAWKDCMWVGVPRLRAGQNLLDNEVKIRLRVAKPYRQYDTGVSSFNNNFPLYQFSTRNLAAQVQQTDVAKNALDLINVVPNPYYAYSNYEANQLDNRVKIVNLPPKCTITIYNPSGTLIRKFNRSVSGENGDYNSTAGARAPSTNNEASQDWDLKNSLGIPISSGMYIIHIDAPGIGERTVKWFGVIRPIDLESF
jgi:hypothetical protein